MSDLVAFSGGDEIGHPCLGGLRAAADTQGMTILTNGAQALRSLGGWFPRGSTLPQAQWEVRHRAVTWLLLFHAVVFAVASLLKGVSVEAFLTNVSVPALGAYAASR